MGELDLPIYASVGTLAFCLTCLGKARWCTDMDYWATPLMIYCLPAVRSMLVIVLCNTS